MLNKSKNFFFVRDWTSPDPISFFLPGELSRLGEVKTEINAVDFMLEKCQKWWPWWVPRLPKEREREDS
jgi:hypothetical protein